MDMKTSTPSKLPEACDLRGHFIHFWSGEKTNRKTEQKMALLRALYTSKQHHLTAEELFRLVKKQLPQLSETTVYRTLKRLVDEGLAVRLQLVPEQDHYERVREAHAHAVCDQCEDIQHVPLTHVPAPYSRNHFAMSRTDITYRGLCQSCRSGER